MAKSYADLDDEQLRNEHERYQRKARRKSLYRRHVANIESVMSDRGMDVNPSPDTDPMLDGDETDESGVDSGSTGYEGMDYDSLQEAHERYSDASTSYPDGGWGDVVSSIEEELARREECDVAELSAGALGESVGRTVAPNLRVHGIAIGSGDVTYTENGSKRWGYKALDGAVSTLVDSPVVRDHVNDRISAVCGKITRAKYDHDAGGVAFEAELSDEDVFDKVQRGMLECSLRVKHAPESELETNDNGTVLIENRGDIRSFDNLAIVTSGASASNELAAGGMDD